jgi:hypothetical protein
MILLGFVGWGVKLRATGGAMGSVGSVEQESAGKVGSALRLEGLEGSVELEVERE